MERLRLSKKKSKAGQHQQLLQEIKAIPSSMAVSTDGRYLAMSGDKKIIVWQLK
jgi:hypothetical protein